MEFTLKQAKELVEMFSADPDIPEETITVIEGDKKKSFWRRVVCVLVGIPRRRSYAFGLTTQCSDTEVRLTYVRYIF